MSNILITSVGTGNYDPQSKQVHYRRANYYTSQDNTNTFETPYIAEALKHFYEIDKIIFIGTCGSDWFSLYHYICGNEQTLLSPPADFDDSYAEKLLELYTHKNKRTLDPAAESELLCPLIKAFRGSCPDIILLRYGLDDSEIVQNFNLLRRIGNNLDDSDCVYFDITHSFRSLPVYELLVINYLKDVLDKNIEIKMISYGMIDISGEMDGKTPIVNLNRLTDTFDYMKAAEEYRRFGTAFSLIEILSASPQIDLTQREKTAFALFNDAISANNIEDFKMLIRRCHNIINSRNSDSQSDEYKILSDVIFSDLDRRFYNKLNDNYELQFELAEWHYEKNRYMACAITLVETIVNFCAALCDNNVNKGKIRTKLWTVSSVDQVTRDFLILYNKIRRIRNNLSHALYTPNQRAELVALGHTTNRLKMMYINDYKSNEQNRNYLKIILCQNG